MNYSIEQSALFSPFVVPAEIADKHLKLATHNQLRVILYILRNIAVHPDIKAISKALNIPETETVDAVSYWADAGILITEKKNTSALKKRTSARIQSEKPSREEIAQLSTVDDKLPFLFSEIQVRLSRPLRQNETSTFAWLYSEEGMDISVILMLVEYAVKMDKPNIRFIERTAIEWLDAGVEDLASAEEYISKSTKEELCFKLLASAFGIKDRKLNKTEKQLAIDLIENKKFGREMLEEAYDLCVDATGKYNINYIKGIFERWKKDNIRTLNDIKKPPEAKNSTKKDNHSAIDKDLLAQLLNND